MKKNNLFQDERFKDIFKTLCTRFYIITMLFVWGDIMYRSMILKQPPSQFEDLNIIMTLNVLLFLPSVFYYSGLSFKKLKPGSLVLIYLLMVVLGTVVTIFKYRIYDTVFILGKTMIIAAICAIIVSVYVFFAWFGYRRIEKEIESDD